MASTIIHMCIAKEMNKKLKKDETKLILGSIAPDIGKLVNIGKTLPHFSTKEDEDIPVFDYFLDKYQKYLDDDFVLGYYIHLYTDYLWFKYFMTEITDKKFITKLDGTVVDVDEDTLCEYVYNDYTNLNIKLIDRYNLDLKIFYNEVPNIKSIIDEIPMDKLNLLIDKAGIILENSTQEKQLIFNIEEVEKFISLCIDIIISALNEEVPG